MTEKDGIAGQARNDEEDGIAGQARNDGEESGMTGRETQEIRAGRKAAGPDVKGFNLQGRRLAFRIVSTFDCCDSPSIRNVRIDENLADIHVNRINITLTGFPLNVTVVGAAAAKTCL